MERQLKLGFKFKNWAVTGSPDHQWFAAVYQADVVFYTRLPSLRSLCPFLTTSTHHLQIFQALSAESPWAFFQALPLPSNSCHFHEKEECLVTANIPEEPETLTLDKFIIVIFCSAHLSHYPAHPYLIFHNDFSPQILLYIFWKVNQTLSYRWRFFYWGKTLR